MTKSFLTHLSTIIALHALVLMGTWQLSQSDYVQSQLTKLGTNVLKLQIASKVVMSSPPVQKKVERLIPTNPNKPRTAPVEEQKVNPTMTSVESTKGSEFATAQSGKTDSLSVYKSELRAMIEKNKYYPTMSRRLGQTGTVVVAFTLLEDGHIIDVRIDSPSHYDRLNESAVEAVKKVERFKPIPKEIGETKMAIKVPVKFFTI
jgi:protein TonB